MIRSRQIDAPAANAAGARGFSLMEVIVATLIATLVVSGLAYTFGLGRGFIDRFEIARLALAQAQGTMDQLVTLDPSDPQRTLGIHAGPVFSYQGRVIGAQSWQIYSVADPVVPQVRNALRNVTVSIIWNSGGGADSVQLTRLLLPY